MRERDPRLREDDAWKGDAEWILSPHCGSRMTGVWHWGGWDKPGRCGAASERPQRGCWKPCPSSVWILRLRPTGSAQDDTRARLQAGGDFPHHQINQLFLLGIIFAISYPRGLNFISFRVWNFEFCGIFWKRRGWGMSRARRIIFA